MRPVARVLAIVVGDRTKVSGGGEHSSVSTTYYATLEFETGRRAELRCDDATAGEIARNDIGVAYLKGGKLVHFWRIAGQ